MKTTMQQQLRLIDEIVSEDSRPRRVILLREWLESHGYEDPGLCTHPTVYRTTGKCTSCGVLPE